MKPNHIASLDGLRAIAALSVLFQHIVQQIYPDFFRIIGVNPSWLGWAGVTLFFLLSGFCIHYPQALLEEEQGKSKLNNIKFAKHRIFRIYPAYVVAIIISLIVGHFVKTNLLNGSVNVADISAHIMFIHNLSPITFYSINAVFWTIAIEVQFYILYAIFYKYFRFTFKETFFLMVSALIWYFFVSILFTDSWRFLLQLCFISTFWIWHLGATLARYYCQNSVNLKFHKYYFIGVMIAALTTAFVDPVLLKLHIIYWIGPIIFAVLLWQLIAINTPKLLNDIGKISYSLYLLHPVAIAFALSFSGYIVPLAAVFFALILATLSYLFIEKPFIALKNIKFGVLWKSS